MSLRFGSFLFMQDIQAVIFHVRQLVVTSPGSSHQFLPQKFELVGVDFILLLVRFNAEHVFERIEEPIVLGKLNQLRSRVDES